MKRQSLVWIAIVLMSGCAGLKLADPLHIGERDWPMFGKDQTRTNATNEIVAPPLTLAWEHDITSGMGYGSPIIIDSVVIVTNLRGEMYGINAKSGKRIGWVSLGDAFQGSPVIDENIAYMAASNTRESLIAFDLLEGKVVWKHEFGDIEVTPLLYHNRLFFGNVAGNFFSVDKAKGELVWKFKLPENTKRKGIRSTATVCDNLIIFGAEDGSVYALDATYGTERWSYNTGAPVFASPAASNGVAYCGNVDGKLFAFNVKNGTVLWQFNAGSSVYATLSFANNLTLIGTTGGMLHALNVKDGSLAWSKELNGVINSSAVVSGNIAYVGTLKKELYAIKTDDGSVVWKETLQGRIKTSPAVAQGKVFVATDDKMILAFKPIEK